MSERLLLLLPVPERSPVTAIKKAHSPLPPQNLNIFKKNATTNTVIVNTSGRSSLLPNLLLVQWLAGDECRPCTRLCDKFKLASLVGKAGVVQKTVWTKTHTDGQAIPTLKSRG